jgi:60 kDa SS-A/Ro ribonucleoprotein
MANRTLFGTRTKRAQAPPATARNEAGGLAYALPPQEALAQLAMTGCLTRTFYADAETQVEAVLAMASQCSTRYVAQAALYARERGYMKDIPALLVAHLAARLASEPTIEGQFEAGRLFRAIFPRVIDNGRMLRNFVQIIRSGATGRRSLGTSSRHMIANWLNARDGDAVFRLNVGQQPTLADIVKLAHPHPRDATHRALFGYLLGREHDAHALPMLVRDYEAYKRALGNPDLGYGITPPQVPFEMLTSLPLQPADWKTLARHASWQQTRQLLNTFARHGVFEDAEVTSAIAARLANPEAVARAKVFPYQLLTAYRYTEGKVPFVVREALQDAMDAALGNVPALPGQIVVCPDISGSMRSPVTGQRGTATTEIRCKDVAGLITASILRRNPASTRVLAFGQNVTPLPVNPRDTVMTTTSRIAGLPEEGTDCSAPVRYLIDQKIDADLVVIISDNESWIDTAGKSRHTTSWGGNQTEATGLMEAWARYRTTHPAARLVCIDLQPNTTVQTIDRPDILNVGGFGDSVYDLLPLFAAGELAPGAWVHAIERRSI